MGSLDVYYLREHDDSPVVLTAPEDVDSLIDRVRSESPVNAPILMDVHLSGDPGAQGLDVGVARDRGAVRYAGRDWPSGVFSANGRHAERGAVRSYFYMDHEREFPEDAEISLDLIRQGIKEFMVSDGARPTCIEWQSR